MKTIRSHRVSAASILAALAGTAFGQPSTEPFPAVFELSSLLPENGGDGTNGFVLNGIDVFDQSGRTLATAGDVNGDGIDDLIIGAFNASPNGTRSGESYVVFGGMGVGAAGVIELSGLDGSNGFTLNGIDPVDFSGWSVDSAGDVNGDGFDDLIIGAYRADPNEKADAGESYVVFGGETVGTSGVIELSSLNGVNGFVITGANAGDWSAIAVASAGDVNGDGFDDLLIGAFNASPNGRVGAGAAYVVFGSAGVGSSGIFELSSLDGTNGFVLHGINRGDRAGSRVSSAGDFNGDGFGDLTIGAFSANPRGTLQAGECYVFFGGESVGASGVIELSSLDGSNGFVLRGIDIEDRSGAVALAGDLNADGFDDVIIGAPFADPNGIENAGENYVVFGGKVVGSGGVIELSLLDGSNGFTINGIGRLDFSGRVSASAGDINMDGVDDLIVSVSSESRSYIIFGSIDVGESGTIELRSLDGTRGFAVLGTTRSNLTGADVAGEGDINGDGIDDLIIGASAADPNGSSGAGQSYVVFGRDVNQPPDCTSDVVILAWPPNHQYETFDIDLLAGVTDSDGDEVTITVTGITQDEAINAMGDGNTSCDAEILDGSTTVRLRRERAGSGDGRVYRVHYLAHDGNGGDCSGFVEIHVPREESDDAAIDSGLMIDATTCNPRADLNGDGLVQFRDLTLILGNWGRSGFDDTLNWPDGDVDFDGTVDFGDITALLSQWGFGSKE